MEQYSVVRPKISRPSLHLTPSKIKSDNNLLDLSCSKRFSLTPVKMDGVGSDTLDDLSESYLKSVLEI